MLSSLDFSYRKFKRKADSVGYRRATTAALELLARKAVLAPIVDSFCSRDLIHTVSRNEFSNASESFIPIGGTRTDYGVLEAPFVADIRDGYVLTGTGLVVDKDGQLLNEALFPPGRGRRFVVAKLIWQSFFGDVSTTGALLRRDMDELERNARSIETAAPLIPRYSDNYYHWTIETLPQIRYLEAFENETGHDVTYLVPGTAPSWLDETLELLGIPSDKVEHVTEPVYSVDRLVLPSFPVGHREEYQWFVDRILASTHVSDRFSDAGDNVFISRSNAIERRVVNEEAVVSALEEYGFERYHLEDRSVAENVALFNRADVVVGAHGAGLTDLIYCDDGAVIELFGAKIKDPYEELAETMNVEYESLECSPESTDIVVDTEALTDTVERYL